MDRKKLKEMIRPLVVKILKESFFGPTRMQLQNYIDALRKRGTSMGQAITRAEKVYGVTDIKVRVDGTIIYFKLGGEIQNEASSTVGGTAGPYQTPYAFGNEPKRKKIAQMSGYKIANARADSDDSSESKVNKNKFKRL